ncbi:MAG TPA: T9SS type A sorting domain-containing protein [Bacteroidia bacterium]|nr:T9SS type A sorting domain-containing protein [Bacteroidia bacterium]
MKNRVTTYLGGLAVLLLCAYSGFGQITRTQIHLNAIPFTTYTFTTTSANITTGTNCSTAGGNVVTPSWVTVGANKVGMPYCWGGFSSLTSFTNALLTGKSAGDDDCSTNGDCCEDCALGVDCSGFVSRAWGLTTKQSTNTLPGICTTFSSAMDVLQGDIFDLPGSHTRLVDTNYEDGTMLLIESSAVDWKVSYRSYTISNLTSYTPMGYTKTTPVVLPCNYFYASMPYSNDFTTWVMDSCNSGAERVPGINWKCSIGGTTPDGDDFWHRDDYTYEDWSSPTSGAYTPAAATGATHSARFHNEPAVAASTGALDLYIDLSPAGTKTISFYMIHNEASPSPYVFNVELSTDGGKTFGTPLFTNTAQIATWTKETVTTTATSATSVIRFIATDKGNADVGLDNVSVTNSGPTGIAEINANTGFELYPNPTDGTILNGKLASTDVKTLDVRIYDMMGREVVAKQLTVQNGTFSMSMSNAPLAAGTYMFVGVSGDSRFMKPVVVK